MIYHLIKSINNFKYILIKLLFISSTYYNLCMYLQYIVHVKHIKIFFFFVIYCSNNIYSFFFTVDMNFLEIIKAFSKNSYDS